MTTKSTPTSATEPGVEELEGTISFSVRLTKRQRDLLARAAEKRGWSLTSLLKNAGLEKAVHILNTSATNRVDFRATAEEIANAIFAPRSGRELDGGGAPVPRDLCGSLEEARAMGDVDSVEVSPWHKPPEFLLQIREAVRYGGTEFLDLIVRASDAITSRQGNLADPIDPGSI